MSTSTKVENTLLDISNNSTLIIKIVHMQLLENP